MSGSTDKIDPAKHDVNTSVDHDSNTNTNCEPAAYYSTKVLSSTATNALIHKTAGGTHDSMPIPSEIAPVLRPLISQLHPIKEIVKYEQLEPLLIRLMKSCRGAEGFTRQVSSYLVSNPSIVHHLLLVAESTLEGKCVSSSWQVHGCTVISSPHPWVYSHCFQCSMLKSMRAWLITYPMPCDLLNHVAMLFLKPL